MKKKSRFYVIINLTLVIVSHLLGQQGCCKGGILDDNEIRL